VDSLVQQLQKPQCDDIDQFERSAKTLVTYFVHIYQSKDVTPLCMPFLNARVIVLTLILKYFIFYTTRSREGK